MGISLYTPPGQAADEPARERAVLESGLLMKRDSEDLARIAARAAAIVGTTMAAVTVIHQERQIILTAIGLDAMDSTRSVSFCGHAVLAPGTVMCVTNAETDDRFAGNPMVMGEPHLRFYAGAPLVSADGHALGTLCVFDRHPRTELSATDAAALRALAAGIVEAGRPMAG